MAHEPHAFENQIFDHYRKTADEINNSIKILVEHNYTVIDLEGQIINKENINKDHKPFISASRYSQRNKE
tara:strand:+ start:9676 stop:9885 length:210 start_codon:yes stop_codon:yes gene_type:complete